jgi:hypothetical protein
MYRAPVAFVALVSTGLAQQTPPSLCTDGSCPFDVQAFEEFSVDYDVVLVSDVTDHQTELQLTRLATAPTPSTFLSEHGSIAVHARNLQLKVDSHATFPEGMFPPDHYPPAVNAILGQMMGADIHEELHVNGLTGQASFHMSSPIVNMCIQIDNLPPVAQIQHAQIDANLHQAEQFAPALIQNGGRHLIVDGEPSIGILAGPGNWFVVSNATRPELVTILAPTPVMLGVKFHNYENTVGSQFGVRACEVESLGTQSLLSSNPEAREFVASRIADHQRRLKAVLEPQAINTRFNFIPLEIADLMMAPIAPGGQPCPSDLAETSPKDTSILQMVSLGVCTFTMGIATTYGALRKKSVVSADAYHEVLLK